MGEIISGDEEAPEEAPATDEGEQEEGTETGVIVETPDGEQTPDEEVTDPAGEEPTEGEVTDPADNENTTADGEGTDVLTDVTYTVTFPSDENLTVSDITGAVEQTDGTYTYAAASEGTAEDITFKAAAKEGYEINGDVTYAVGEAEAVTLTPDGNGVYRISAASVTGNIIISAAAKAVTEEGGETVDKVTVTFDGYEGKDKSHYEIFAAEKVADREYTKKAAAEGNTLEAAKNEEFAFIVEVADKYSIDSVTCDGKGVAYNNFQINDGDSQKSGRVYYIGGDTVTENKTIKVEIKLERSKAHQVRFTTTEGGDSNFTIAADGTEIDTQVAGKMVYTAKGTVDFTVTPNSGYQIKGIYEADGTTPVATPEEGKTTVTFSRTFTEAQEKVTYRVDVAAIPLAAVGGTVTFTKPGNVTLAVTTDDGSVTAVEGETNKYQVNESAEYVQFTLTPATDKIVPVVYLGTDKTNEWPSKNEESPYQYKIAAGLFAEGDTAITIDTVAAKRSLTVKGNGVDLYGAAITVKGTSPATVEAEETGTDENDVGYAVYRVDVDSVVDLVVSAEEGVVITSYQKDAGEAVAVEDQQTLTLSDITVAEDTTYLITTKSVSGGDEGGDEPAPAPDDKRQLTGYLLLGSEEVAKETDGSYKVSYDEEYTAKVSAREDDKNATDVKLSSAKMLGAEASTAVIQTKGSGKDVVVDVSIKRADAGKELTMELYEAVEGAANEAAKERLVASYVLRVEAVPSVSENTTYASKLTLKKKTTTVYTGQTKVKIADAIFDNNAEDRAKDIESAVDLTDPYRNSDTESPSTEVYWNGSGEIFMDVSKNLRYDEKNDTYYYDTSVLGKHTIEVTAEAPDETEPAKATIVVTVVQGINGLTVETPASQIYKVSGKAASLKTTLTYNDGSKAAAPKTKKVTYSLVNWTADKGYTEYVSPMSAGSKPKPLVTVDTKGQVKVDKNFDVSKATEAQKAFYVKAAAADFEGNTAVDYTEKITITSEAKKFAAVYIVDEVRDENGDITGFRNSFAGGTGKNDANVKKTSAELEGRRVIAVYNAKQTLGDVTWGVDDPDIAYADAPTYLTYKSSNKALAIDKEGRISVSKANVSNITITVTANDGSKESQKLEYLGITYNDETTLGLKVERKNSYDGVKDDNYTFVDQQAYAANQTINMESYTSASDTVLKLTVVDAKTWKPIQECGSYTVGVSGGKVLKKETSAYGQVVTTVIPNKDTVTVTLTDKRKKGVKPTKYTIKNNGFKDTKTNKTIAIKASNIKTTDALQANVDKRQEIKYTVTLPAGLVQACADDQLYVMVKTDAADRSNAKKADAYRGLEAAGDVNACIPILADNYVAEHKNEKNKTIPASASFTLYFNGMIPANSYKLQMVFGTCSNENDETYNDITPITNAVAVTLKAAAVKKGSYKPFTAAKMSVKDMSYVSVAGTGKNFNVNSERYYNLKNTNVAGKSSKFTDYFEVDFDGWDEEKIVGLRLKSDSEIKAAGRKRTGSDVDVDEELAWLASNDKAAKAARTASMSYRVCNNDGSLLKSGTTKITVTLNAGAGENLAKTKTMQAYASAGTKIMTGTTKATVKITAAKKPASLDYVYVESNEAGFVLDSDYQIDWEYGGSDSVSLKTENKNLVAKAYPIKMYVVPSNSYYTSEISGKYSDWYWAEGPEKEAKKTALEKAIETKGVLVNTKITVVKPATGKKIAVAKNDLAKKFVSCDGTNFNIWVPYTTNVEGVHISNIVTDEGVADPKNNAAVITFSEGDEYIKISLPRAKANTTDVKNTKTSKGVTTVKVKATAYFGTNWATDAEGNNGHWETDSAISKENITFTLTLPTLSKYESYADVVKKENLEAAKKDIEENVTLKFWNGMTGLDEAYEGATLYPGYYDEYWDEEDNYKYEWVDSDVFNCVKDAIFEVERILTETYAPEDSGTQVDMTQYHYNYDEGFVEEDNYEYIELGEITLPQNKKAGSLKVKVTFRNRANGEEETTQSYTLKIREGREQPGDVEDLLYDFVEKAENGSLNYDLRTNDTDYNIIANVARDYLQLRKKYPTLRLDVCPYYYEGWYDESDLFEKATAEYDGYIRGSIHVWGSRYGGAEKYVDFNIPIPSSVVAIEGDKKALDSIMQRYMDNVTEIDGIRKINYDDKYNTFTLAVDDDDEKAKFIKANAEAWRDAHKDSLDTYKNILAKDLTDAFGEKWKDVKSISVTGDGTVRPIMTINGETKEYDLSKALNNSKVVVRQENETIRQFADRFYEKLMNEDTQKEYIDKCNQYLAKEVSPMFTVDDIRFNYLRKAAGTIKITVTYNDNTSVSQSYRVNVK